MIEQELTRVENEIKALKSSMPVSGSLVDTSCITKNSSQTYPNNTTFTCTINFAPGANTNTSGLVTTSIYVIIYVINGGVLDPRPYAVGSNATSRQQSDGSVTITTSLTPYFYGGDSYEVRVTANVYGTIPGTLSITWA